MTIHRRSIITGAAGLIGLHLTRAHLSLGDTILALDNFTTGRLATLRRLTLGDDYRRLTIRPHDVTLPHHDPTRRRFDITRVTLEDGLTQTIAYLRLALGRRATP